MFDNLNFWTDWPKRQRNTLLFFLLLIIISAVLLVIVSYSGGSLVIGWADLNTTKPVRILFDKFYSGVYEFSIFADNHVITRTLIPGEIKIHAIYSYLFLLVFTIIILFLYSLATSLSRFYFLLSSVFFAIILLTFRWENLLLFGFFGKEVYATILVLYLGTGYYFHAFKSHVSVAYRFTILLIISLCLAIVIQLFTRVDQPFLYLSAYVVVAPLVLSVAFIFLLGFEIVRGFLHVVSQTGGSEGKSNFLHFAIITIIYLGVLTLIFLYRHNYIEWKIVFIDSVWILLVASVIGFWGYRMKEELYEHIYQFRTTGAYMYLSLALLCFTSFAFFYVTANDPYIDVLNDAILITQLCFGLLFFVYVISNFLPAMAEGHSVHNLIYKPRFMPYFSAKLASFVGVTALFLIIHMAPYYQAYAGYFVSLAQLFKSQNNMLLAKEYYKYANIYGSQTQMANYALANISNKEGNYYQRDNYLALAINTNPTDFAFAMFANGYSQQNKNFDEIFALKNGVTLFPDSGPLHNNLGLAFSKLNIVDTSIYHFQKALKNNSSRKAAKINISSTYTRKVDNINWDSIANILSSESDVAVLNNLAVLYQKNNRDFNLKDTLDFSPQVSMERLVYNYSLLFDHPEMADSSSWKAFRNHYQQKESITFEENLEYAFAHSFIKTGKSIAALRTLRGLNQADNYGYAKYDLLMAQALMKFNAPEMALPYFEKTIRYYEPEFTIQFVLALMESKKFEVAKGILEKFREQEGVSPSIVIDLLNVLNTDSVKNIVDKNDLEKYNYLTYKGDDISSTQYEGVIISMEDEGYQYAAYVALIGKLLDLHKYDEIPAILEKVDADNIATRHIKIDYLKLLIRYYWNTSQQDVLATLSPVLEIEKWSLGSYYWLAKLTIDESKNLQTDQLYEDLSVYDAFCEECILASSNFFSEKGEAIKSYNILLESIEWNKNSIPLSKAYIKKSIEMGFDNFADDVLLNLESYLPAQDYQEIIDFSDRVKSENKPDW